VDPRTGSLRLDATFPNPDGLLRPGQTVRVRLSTQTLRGVPLIPQRAVIEMQGTWQVYVVGGDGAVHLRPVELGPKVGGQVVVTRGLDAGARVVTDGLQKIRDGQKVSVAGEGVEARADGGTP